MELTLHHPENHHFVRALTDRGFQINDTECVGAVIVSADQLIADWPVSAVEQLNERTLQPIFDLQPEIVVIGTGATQVFPDAAIMMLFHRRGIGVEAMTSHAACRTFNVLMSESRNAAAALLPLDGDPSSIHEG